MKILNTTSLRDTMEQRAKHYDKLSDQFTALRKAFQEIIDLDNFEGKGAEAIKGFYQGQIEVVEAWQRLFDRQIAFFKGVGDKLDDKDLGGSTRVETSFLEEDLAQKERQADEMITEQRRALENIFRDIDDLITLDAFSRDRFDDLMMDASKKRTKTIEIVEDTDQELKEEYLSSEGEEAYAIQLFSALLGATKKGSSISPIHFDADTYHSSDVYKLKGEAEAATLGYITYKKEEQEAREIAKRPASEKVWDRIKSFVGEFTGYYDYKRAVEGVDPVTGEKMSGSQKVTSAVMAAAGFIPIVGWAGRAIKGGKGIYSAAKGISAAEQAMNTYKNVQAFSSLEKTEMGIYGLLSANGLSEYVTGKDMFGNEITEEQRQASLSQSIFAGMPFVPGIAKNATQIGQEAFNVTAQITRQGRDVTKGWMDELGQSLGSYPKLITANGIAPMSDFMKTVNKEEVKSVSHEKEEILSMLSGRNYNSEEISKYNNKTMEHIFHGEINRRDKAVGYHHESMMGGKIIPETETLPDINGVYRANVEISGIRKIAKSSFFPKDWDRVQVLEAISEAFENKRQIGNNKYSGTSSSGITIEMYLNSDGSIATAYPIYRGV